MLETTIFYISASIFFLAAAIFISVAGFYLIKILVNFEEASRDFKEMSHNLKEKVGKFSAIFSAAPFLFNKVFKPYFKKRKRSEGSKK